MVDHGGTVRKNDLKLTQIQEFHKTPSLQPWRQRLILGGVILGEVLVTVGIVGGQIWIGLSQFLTSDPTVDVVLSATIVGEVGSLVDKSSALRIGPGGRGAPECTAEIDGSEFIGIWSRYSSVAE